MMDSLLESKDSEVQFWPSYADVALVVIIFLLLVLFTMIIISMQRSAAMLKVQEEQESLREMIGRVLDPNDVTIIEDGTLQRFSFSGRILFASSRAELRDEGKEILAKLGNVLRDSAGAYSNIQIEGHTDDVKINTREYPSNWELSSARATSVVRFYQDSIRINPDLLSATGYSQYKPLPDSIIDKLVPDTLSYTDSLSAARALNRRIEVVVVYSTLDSLGRSRNTQPAPTSIIATP